MLEGKFLQAVESTMANIKRKALEQVNHMETPQISDCLEWLEKRPETIAQVVHHGNPHANQVKEPFPPAMESNKGKVVGIVVEARLAKEVTSLDFLRRIP